MVYFRTRTCFILSLQYVKELLSVLTAVFLAESDGKDKALFANLQILTTLFFQNFFKNSLPGFPRNHNLYLSESGCKDNAINPPFPNFLNDFFEENRNFFSIDWNSIKYKTTFLTEKEGYALEVGL